ncbi:hypothetical protein OCU04_001416 [Sclerotinia nivalis]|uniref:Uncharacterized protein n=1 Tax=Sclerotinia nivalis TaxID=352851 RepID=A0A9X0DPE3_9HELO|nr:hypothetical protein OCU04_001416 [Sclerotinia nivalis]
MIGRMADARKCATAPRDISNLQHDPPHNLHKSTEYIYITLKNISMSEISMPNAEQLRPPRNNNISSFRNVHIPGRPSDSCYDVHCLGGIIRSITTDNSPSDVGKQSDYRLIVPGLCHPHIHLDKCFLLSHPKYVDLEINEGDFSEAMKLTSEAKSRFEYDGLMERGRALVVESIQYGVTHMRAFVEVDFGVGMKCLDAGLTLKREFYDKCYIQICVFAQDPIFSYDYGSPSMTTGLHQ